MFQKCYENPIKLSFTKRTNCDSLQLFLENEYGLQKQGQKFITYILLFIFLYDANIGNWLFSVVTHIYPVLYCCLHYKYSTAVQKTQQRTGDNILYL